MAILFTNNAASALAADISNVAVSLSVQAGAGALYPALAGSDYFYCTLSNVTGGIEIVRVTARATDTFTIVRGQDNTSAAAWLSGDKVELRLVAASLGTPLNLPEALAAVGGGLLVRNDPAGGLAATTVQAALNELDTEKVSRTSTTGSGIIPVGTTAQRDGAPAAGYLRYNTSIASFEGYSGSAWGSVGGGATGAGGDTVFNENSLIVNNSYTLTAGKNAMSVGPITVASGQTVTIPSGSRWVVL